MCKITKIQSASYPLKPTLTPTVIDTVAGVVHLIASSSGLHQFIDRLCVNQIDSGSILGIVSLKL